MRIELSPGELRQLLQRPASEISSSVIPSSQVSTPVLLSKLGIPLIDIENEAEFPDAIEPIASKIDHENILRCLNIEFGSKRFHVSKALGCVEKKLAPNESTLLKAIIHGIEIGRVQKCGFGKDPAYVFVGPNSEPRPKAPQLPGPGTLATYKRILKLLHSQVGTNGCRFNKLAVIVKCELGLRETSVKHALRYGVAEGIVRKTGFGQYSFSMPQQVNVQDPYGYPKRKRRNISKEIRARLRSLQNPIIYLPLVKKLEALNPDGRFDPQMLDTSLEPAEALSDLKAKHPDLNVDAPTNQDFREEYRDYLQKLGIDNTRMQDLIISKMESDEPYTDDEISQFAQTMKIAQANADQTAADSQR